MKHIVFVDSSATGVLAFRSAKRLGCYVTFVKPQDSSFMNISFKSDDKIKQQIAFVDQYLEVPDLDEAALRPLLDSVHAVRPIDAIISTSEAAIVAVAREAEHFGTLYPSHDALCNAVFKHRCRDRLEQAGVRSPKFEVLTEAQLVAGGPARVALPYVIKPTRGFGKQFSAICLTEADLAAFTGNVIAARASSDPMIDQLISREYIVEQYIRGTLYSAETIVQNGVTSVFATTIRFRSTHSELLEMTSTMPAGLALAEKLEMERYVQQVFSALGLEVGLYHVEIMRDEQGPCLIEINARMIGGVAPRLYQMLSDVDPFELLIRLHLGERLNIDDSKIKNGGTTVVVGARTTGTVSAAFDAAKLELLLQQYGVAFSTLDLVPGRAFSNFAGNLSLIGYVIILAADPGTAARQGCRFLRELEQLVGFDLAQFAEPAF
jgi:biotin carboxylase